MSKPSLWQILQVMFGRPATHRGTPTSHPRLIADVRYVGAAPPPFSSNVHGEIELLDTGVEATHWFVEAQGVTWHFVSAGNPENAPLLFLHGLPESWYAFHHQMAALSEENYVLSFDSLGYGQSDKRLSLDYSNPALAKKFKVLLDKINIDQFRIVAHDRGSVLVDYLTELEGMQRRILRYVRMQQSADEPHGEPKPPHKMFASKMGVKMFRSHAAFWPYQKASGFVQEDVSEAELQRAKYEFHVEGVAEAVSKYFQSTNFDLELADRHDRLFKTMSMPVLFLQGKYDPGQHPAEYENTPNFVENGRVQFLEAAHFPHIENPEEVTRAIRDFIAD